MSDSQVLRYVLDTITPASAAHAEGARLHLAKAGTPMLERLGMTVAGAQHTPRPRADRRTVIVVAGDHGAGDPGISLGASHPTIIAAQAIADGSSALSQIARASRAPVVLVAAGVKERTHLPAMAIELAGRPSANIVGPRSAPALVQIGKPRSATKESDAATTKTSDDSTTKTSDAATTKTSDDSTTKTSDAATTKTSDAATTKASDASTAKASAGSRMKVRAGSTTKPLPTRDAPLDAMTLEEAALGVESGIALAISLSEPGPDRPRDLPSQPGLDVIALGAIGVGSDVASAALLGAALGVAPTGLGDVVAETAGARGAEFATQRRGARGSSRIVAHGGSSTTGNGGAMTGDNAATLHDGTTYGLELLSKFGGPDTAVLAGLILAAASMNIPVILDGYATGAAALVAVALAPQVTGYLVAAHNGTFTMPRILAHLGIQPVFEVGLGHGEGTGAAMVLPMLDQVAAIAAGA